MKIFAIIVFCGLFTFNYAWLEWSSTYTLKAVLVIPEANITEPYQVWYDGSINKSRVDYYHGLTKLYRQWDAIEEEYQYFKVHPAPSSVHKSKEVCLRIAANSKELKNTILNSYLPDRNFQFVGKEQLDGVETEKWQYVYQPSNSNIQSEYTMWITGRGKTIVPVRFLYEEKQGETILDTFRHDYTFYDETKPAFMKTQLPLGMECEVIKTTVKEPQDPLMEFTEPEKEHARVKKAFKRFKKEHGKQYKEEGEEKKRLMVFKNHMRYINTVNRQHRSYTLGINQFADRTKEELSVLLATRFEPEEFPVGDKQNNLDDLEETGGNLEEIDLKFDWRDYGAVTPIKDQTTMCGSCYAFAATAAVESSYFVFGGCQKLEELSEQSIIDCSWGTNVHIGNTGCAGGRLDYTLKWIRQNGLPLKSEYGPYLAIEGKCHNQNMTVVKIKDFVRLYEIHVLKKSIQKVGVVAAVINSEPLSFTFYHGGVYKDPECKTEVRDGTHAVSVVGYGYTDETHEKYWIVKNSYGTTWGEHGYMRLARPGNVCGVMNSVYKVKFHGKTDNFHCFMNNLIPTY